MAALPGTTLPTPVEIDFGKAFNAPSHAGLAVASPFRENKSVSSGFTKLRLPRLGRSDWTNIVFVASALVGGLFCAFYFYNGADLLRSAARWPGEFFYGRALANQNPAIIDLVAKTTADSSGSPTRSTSPSQYGPFSRIPGVTAANQPPSPAKLVANNPSSFLTRSGATPASPLLTQLALPAPGGGTLAQAFNQGVADVQTAAAQDAHRVVTVIQAATSRVKGRIQSAAKHVVVREHERLIGATNRIAASAATLQTSPRAFAANAVQNQTSPLLRSTTNTLPNNLQGGLGGLGNLRSATSNPLGGLGGSLGGAGLGGGFHSPISVGGGRH